MKKLLDIYKIKYTQYKNFCCIHSLSGFPFNFLCRIKLTKTEIFKIQCNKKQVFVGDIEILWGLTDLI